MAKGNSTAHITAITAAVSGSSAVADSLSGAIVASVSNKIVIVMDAILVAWSPQAVARKVGVILSDLTAGRTPNLVPGFVVP